MLVNIKKVALLGRGVDGGLSADTLGGQIGLHIVLYYYNIII